ncbi:L-rhamnose-binding lectin ELEL-1-like [Mytilus californianus]|uniref:L-rhamnose-binding lectin ELEL-1-like n=1 Tax=Mytilus californianus TaxID=6549 RepID=UPI0022477239|nr:L-rhamnose-binding lectin ELEL-1-like [Mytilus californianus]
MFIWYLLCSCFLLMLPCDAHCGKTVKIQEDILHSLLNMKRPSCNRRTYSGNRSGVTNVIVCEGHSMYVRCKYPTKIKVVKAMYGRSEDKRICPHSSIKTTSCKAASSDAKIKKQCNGKRICKVAASNSLYGDPCGGTYKYTELKYRCS